MLFRLFLLFTITPIIELYLLIRIGGAIGALPTIAIVVITGLVGAWLARLEGARAWGDLRRSVSGAQFPGNAILNGIAVFIGGAFLLTPGVLTDLLGIALLVPVTRRPIMRVIRERFMKRLEKKGDGEIEVRYWRQEPPTDDR